MNYVINEVIDGYTFVMNLFGNDSVKVAEFLATCITMF